GDRRSALWRDDGGAGRLEADFGPVELTPRGWRMVPLRGFFPMNTAVPSAKKGYGPFLLAPLVVLLAACDLHVGNLGARVTDEWTHTYPLARGGEVRIENTNG